MGVTTTIVVALVILLYYSCMVIVLHITVMLQLYYRSITKATSMVVVHKYFDK